MSTDRSEIFSSCICARSVDGCLSPWASWCRGCNGVFCGAHINDHGCKPEDLEKRKALYQEKPCPPPPP